VRRAATTALALEKEAAQTLERQLLTIQKATVPKFDNTVSSPLDNTVSSPLNDDTSYQDAIVIAHLYTQAVVVQDIRSLITVVLDLLYTKYPR
jgi:hypothetical protein